MTKRSVLAILGLAIALTLVTPSKASAGVVIGVRVGPVVARPAYGYVVVHPRPYYARPHFYAPAYVYPAKAYYGGFYRGGRWYPRGYVSRAYAGPRAFRR